MAASSRAKGLTSFITLRALDAAPLFARRTRLPVCRAGSNAKRTAPLFLIEGYFELCLNVLLYLDASRIRFVARES